MLSRIKFRTKFVNDFKALKVFYFENILNLYEN